MQGVHLRKYGTAATVNFELYQPDGVNFEPAATFAAGDVKIMKDEGAEANITTLPTDEGQGYSLALSATEMQAARIVVYIVDQTATKVWLDKAIVVETYGDASAAHAFDLGSASPDVNLVQWRGSTPNVLTSAMVDANTRQWAGTAVSAATAGVPDVNTTAINNDTTSAANLALSALGIVSGSFVGTPTTTVQDTDLTNANDDFYAPDPLLIITSGIGAGQRVGITGYNGTTKELTTDPLTVAPAAGDTFVIV